MTLNSPFSLSSVPHLLICSTQLTGKICQAQLSLGTLVCFLLFLLMARPKLGADKPCSPLGWLPIEWVGLCPDVALPGLDEGWLPLLAVIGRRLFPFKRPASVLCLWFNFYFLYHRYAESLGKDSSAWATVPLTLETAISRGQQPEPSQRLTGQDCLGQLTLYS